MINKTVKLDVTEKIAKLSMLRFDTIDMDKLSAEFEKIVEFVSSMKSGVDDCEYDCEKKVSLADLREDSTLSQERISREKLLSNAKTKTEEYVTVPKIIE